MNPLIIYPIVINIFAFLIAVWDKRQAKRGNWRISENTLMLFAVIGGSAGLMVAFILAHHKTRKKKFMIGVPAIAISELIAVLFIRKYM
jgi:uncharacterized membrane protein YsdA (DUF1294 family)